MGGAGEGGGGGGQGHVFCYVNSVFAPGLDEGVGGLWSVSFFLFLLRVRERGEGWMDGGEMRSVFEEVGL